MNDSFCKLDPIIQPGYEFRPKKIKKHAEILIELTSKSIVNNTFLLIKRKSTSSNISSTFFNILFFEITLNIFKILNIL